MNPCVLYCLQIYLVFIYSWSKIHDTTHMSINDYHLTRAGDITSNVGRML